MEKQFTKKNLRTCYLVELRNGTRWIVGRINRKGFEKILVNSPSERKNLIDYNEDLTHVTYENFDIMKVWGLSSDPRYTFSLIPAKSRTLLYSRVIPKKMTLSEIEKELGYPVELVNEEV